MSARRSREGKHSAAGKTETADVQLDTKRFLTKPNARGVSVQDHLTTVLLKIGKDKPGDALAAFEDISANTKASLEVPLYANTTSVADDQLTRMELSKAVTADSLLVGGPPKVAGEEEEPEADPDQEGGGPPDVLGSMALFQWAGVDLGQTETFKLFCSIDRMIKTKAAAENPENPTDVRFWGKIFGLQNDYYIVEGKLAEPPDMPDEGSKAETPGVGVNEFVYYVATSLTGEWQRLPWCTPAMITTSKQMRRYFTGDLKAPVLGFPRFPWGEAAYLRAQIARISAATTICPKGVWEAGEDDEANVLTKAETWDTPSTGDMALFETWVHWRGYILNKEGRVTPYVNEEGGEEDELSEVKKPVEEKEDPIPLLTPIDLDRSAGRKVWSVRASPSLNHSHCVVSMHNFSWPGAVSISKGTTWANVYVGWGHKFIPGPYSPPPPPALAAEYDVAQVQEGKPPLQEQADPLPKQDDEKSPEKDGDDDAEDDE